MSTKPKSLKERIDRDMVSVPGGKAHIRGTDFDFDSYHISKYLVTQELWTEVMGEPWPHGEFRGSRRPVDNVSWDDICHEIKDGQTDEDKRAFLSRLNELTDGNYCLPSESQWEFAARGGKVGMRVPKGEEKPWQFASSTSLEEVGWFRNNSNQESKPVGLLLPNELGLYDISGNLLEWCADSWDGDWGLHKSFPELIDPTGKPFEEGKKGIRVVRGGSWGDCDNYCSVSYRNHFPRGYRGSTIGVRLASVLTL